MNKCIFIGRLTDDPAIRGEGEKKLARYSLAVERFKEGADFPNCVAFGKQADFAEKYLSKGKKIAIVGRLQTGSYEKDGRKVYTTDIVVESQEFCEPKSRGDRFEELPTDFFNPFEEA